MSNGERLLSAIGQADEKFIGGLERRARAKNVLRHVLKSLVFFLLSLLVLTLLYFLILRPSEENKNAYKEEKCVTTICAPTPRRAADF